MNENATWVATKTIHNFKGVKIEQQIRELF
jgi:hypothetical protein